MTRSIIICKNLVGSSSSGSRYGGGNTGSSSELTQIPSKATDFPGNDQSAIQVHITSAKKDIIGSYHVMGELTNNANSTIQNVMVTAHFYDANNGLVGVSTCCYTTPISLEPGHTATFDSFVQKSDYSGTPATFMRSYDWS
ncbi:MAG: FxLYD domain-containing protein [Thermoproteota archaeon]|nr:FxLYD domain-containing protein [Thermoproteota archaeon]